MLPAKVERLSPDSALVDFSWLLLVGALTASVANILAGALSDRLVARGGTRRPLVVAGLMGLFASGAGFLMATSFGGLLFAMILFQFALNAMFAPIVALLADAIPHARKGWTAGWLNLALPFGSFAMGVAGLLLGSLDFAAFLTLPIIVVFMCAPLLARWPAMPSSGTHEKLRYAPAPKGRRTDFVLAWIARFAMQLGGAVMFGYFFFVVRDLLGSEATTASDATRLTFLAAPPAAVATLVLGRLSDRRWGRRPPLVFAALVAAVALGMIASGPGPGLAVAGYTLFLTSLTLFLALDQALVAELVTGMEDRGKRLGWMNLTNTLPAILVPATSLVLLTGEPGSTLLTQLLVGCALAAVVAALTIARIRTVR
nr:MFS transporter [Sphingomicrobium nitratireducens]